ncbi:MAG: hypothetical protein AAB575_00010 [Patescibacteria group bacterium]
MTEQPKLENKEQKSFLDNWLETEFNADYDAQVKTLRNLGLLEILPDIDNYGIRGVDGNEYPIPTKQQIIDEIRNNPEKYSGKMKYDEFTKIQLTPFALPLERLAMTLESELLEHHSKGKLFAFNETEFLPERPLKLGVKNPFDIASTWINSRAEEGKRGADVTGDCAYHVTAFARVNHGGHTKTEILAAQAGLSFAGWEVKLLENDQSGFGFKSVRIPPERISLAGFLAAFKFGLRGEQGLTNEDWITKFLIRLERKNQVIDRSFDRKLYPLLGSFNLGLQQISASTCPFSRLDSTVSFRLCGVDPNHVVDYIRTAVPIGPELRF